jgi:hypothetical protein
VLNPLGVYQPRWQLFAPAPVDANSWISADVILSDGQRRYWRSPRWRGMNAGQRFWHSRHKKFVANLQRGIHKDEQSPLWPAFADYLARITPLEAGQRVVRVELTCHWYYIDPPADRWIGFGQAPEELESKQFFAKDY